MISTTGRFPEEPLPRLGPEAEAPEFPVTFSRPLEAARGDTSPNSFRWFGKGTLRVMEGGLLVSAKRRFAIGFHTTEQRFVPAWEICDVCRESNAVRVDLRGDPRNRDFFQFWTAEASTAGTIVRLLPTKRTIEYEAASLASAADRNAPAAKRRLPRVHPLISIALALTLIGVAAWIAVTQRHDNTSERTLAPPSPSATTAAQSTAPALRSSTAVPHKPTEVQVVNARVALSRFDDRIDGLRAQFRMAFSALQSGDLSQRDFIDGVNHWLVPQWRTLYKELASGTRNDEPLDSEVRKHLMTVALGWDGALREYAKGLEEGNYLTVLAAIDQMSSANEAQRKAWLLIEREER
jgi:hypothetical protein